jgi:branched-chain amino acid transport system ATP-binding protein
MNTTPLLTIKDLTMRFGGLVAVDHVSLAINQGEIFGLIGPNGAGKTTIFNCITQFYKPTVGTVIFHHPKLGDVELTKLKPHQVIRYGLIRSFQNVELAGELTVLDNLIVAHTTWFKAPVLGSLLRQKGLLNQVNDAKEKALNILAFLGIFIYKDAYPAGLPYGVLKTIELARTLMVDPQLIILDEPAAGLNDSESQHLAETIKFIRDLFHTTIILVEHDMDLVMDVCDRIAVVNFGKLIGLGTPKHIQSLSAVRAAYLGSEE